MVIASWNLGGKDCGLNFSNIFFLNSEVPMISLIQYGMLTVEKGKCRLTSPLQAYALVWEIARPLSSLLWPGFGMYFGV